MNGLTFNTALPSRTRFRLCPTGTDFGRCSFTAPAGFTFQEQERCNTGSGESLSGTIQGVSGTDTGYSAYAGHLTEGYEVTDAGRNAGGSPSTPSPVEPEPTEEPSEEPPVEEPQETEEPNG
jgi:hypothetical protein